MEQAEEWPPLLSLEPEAALGSRHCHSVLLRLTKSHLSCQQSTHSRGRKTNAKQTQTINTARPASDQAHDPGGNERLTGDS